MATAVNQTRDPNRYAAAGVRVVAINGQIIVARRTATTAEIKNWFEKKEEMLADDIRIVSLLDKHDDKTIADAIKDIDFESARLPRFL